MPRMKKKCPICDGALYISQLQCKECNLKLNKEFKISVFDNLNEEQYNFLITFLKCKGNLNSLQKKLNISYASARKQLLNLLKELELLDDVVDIQINKNEKSASNIIKTKLKQSGGKASIKSLTGKVYEIYAKADDKFYCIELESSPEYTFKVFDEIVKGALENGNELPKGDGRGKKFGEPGCDENTVVGRTAMYAGKTLGESVDDPVSIFVAILDWAGIAENKRGYIQLTEEFLEGYMSEQSEYGKSEELYLKQLEEKFKDELIENAERGKILYGYNPKEYIRMIKQYGAVAAVKRLIEITKSGKLPDGFLKLVECNALELTMEASVCNPKYQSLFSAEEIRFCKDLMAMHKD